MGKETPCIDYNSRLFGEGVYGSHHRSRFLWLARKIASLRLRRASLLEVGCHDGRAIEYAPLEIERYVGLDAGAESGVRGGVVVGIEKARRHFGHDGRFSFYDSADPADVWALPGTFDIGICLETLEHIHPDLIDSYLAAFADKVTNGLFITVPNEKGVALLLKTLGAKALGVKRDHYSASEFIHALLGRMGRIPRENHKGFDYAQLVRSLRNYFRSVRVEGVWSERLPAPFQLTVGITATSSRAHPA